MGKQSKPIGHRLTRTCA